nr:HNH endonuclease signature motif containing protein [Micromonospora terminaliae]
MRCRYCDRRVHLRRSGPGRLHIDHVEPYSLVRRHTLDNLVVSCQRCNLSKGADPLVKPRPLPLEAA